MIKGPPPDLCQAWIRWFEVLENLAERQSVGRNLTPEHYVNLRKDVMSACHLYENHPDLQVADTAREMLAFIEPWISLSFLCRTERMLLMDLVRECDTKFGRPDRRRRRRDRFLRLGLPGLLKFLRLLIVVGLLTSTALYCFAPHLFKEIPSWGLDNWYSMLRFTQNRPKTFIALVGFFLTVMAYYVNSARRF